MAALHRTRITPLFLLATAVLLVPSIVQAMEIRQFEKMADQDQSNYIGNLIAGTENVLIDEGRADLAAQVDRLVTEGCLIAIGA